jgi:pYEATS domain-containing protein involved in immunity
VDKLPQVNVHRVTHVVSLAALTIVAVVALAFFPAAWGVYALVVAILVTTIVALILFPQLGLEKEHLRKYVMVRWIARQEKGFDPELSQRPPRAKSIAGAHAETESRSDALERRRTGEYRGNRGLFLGHYWWPSEIEGQVADVAIQLREHPDPEGSPPVLEGGKVESVSYQLGPKFSEQPITKRNSKDNFRLDVSAYGPMLCLAEMTFNDDTEPLYLSRYIDFPEDL